MKGITADAEEQLKHATANTTSFEIYGRRRKFGVAHQNFKSDITVYKGLKKIVSFAIDKKLFDVYETLEITKAYNEMNSDKAQTFTVNYIAY